MKKEIGRLVLLTGSLIILRKLKPEKDKVVLYIFHAHLLELVIDLLLFGY